jgi:uncharacterized protein YdeI (YjbR/CyaY-like superfamily)
MPDLPTLAFPTAAAWEAWLEAHHADAAGVWLAIARKDAETASVTYAEALDVALCFGWIDGQKAAGETPGTWRQRFTRRGPRSRWSRINREKAEALIARGAMRPAGLAEVERARADGRWAAAYEGQGSATVPDDLRAALDADPAAAAAFEALDARNRYAILYRVQAPKRAETRARKIAELVAMLARGERIHR